MHTFLIIGAKKELIDKVVIKITQDNLVKSLIPFNFENIEDSKDLKKLVKFSYSQKTAIILYDFDKATNEAVNSLLKTLEEPSKNLIYILTSKSIDGIIPTIISRSEVIKIGQEKLELKDDKLIIDFINSNLTKAFDILSKIKEREKAIEFVNDLILYDYKNNKLDNLESYLETIKGLKSNGNVSLQLASLLARMNSKY